LAYHGAALFRPNPSSCSYSTQSFERGNLNTVTNHPTQHHNQNSDGHGIELLIHYQEVQDFADVRLTPFATNAWHFFGV
jgi:hypothetical protein